MYVKNVLDNQGGIVSATSGHFSADVELTANFGGGNVIANDQFTIGGEITGFVLQYGEANDWAVKLGLADFSVTEGKKTSPANPSPGSGLHEYVQTVWLQVTSTAAAGSWNGMPSTVPRRGAAIDHDADPDTPGIPILRRPPWLESSTPTSRTEPRPVGSAPT